MPCSSRSVRCWPSPLRPRHAAARPRAEVVVELRAPPVSERAPLTQLRDRRGHVDLQRLGPRLALAAIARQQRAAELRLQARGSRPARERAHAHRHGRARRHAAAQRARAGSRRVPGVRARLAGGDLRRAGGRHDRVPAVVGAPALWSGLDGGIAAAGDGMRIGIIDDGIDMTRPSFSGAGYHYPPGFPKGIRVGHERQDHRRARVRAARRPRAHAHRLRPRRLRARHARRRHRRRPLGHHGRRRSASRSPASRASRRTPTSAPTACSRRRRRRSASTATAPRSRARSTGRWPTAWTCSTSRSASPRSSPANDVVARAIHGAARAGVVTVVAAGNSGDDLGGGSISSPGSAPDAITVAATSVGRFVGVTLGVLGPGAVPGRPRGVRRRDGRARSDPGRLEGRRPAGRRRGLRRRPRRRARARPARAAVHGRARRRRARRRARSASSTRSAPRAIRPRSTTSQQRSLTVSGPGRRAARAAGRGRGRRARRSRSTTHRGEQISANSGLIASFSSRGPAPYSLALKPDVAAPGVDIVSPIPGGYGTWSGTSMASPAVAGAAALLRQRHPTWTPAQIKSALVLTARPVFNDTGAQAPDERARAGRRHDRRAGRGRAGPLRDARGRLVRADAARHAETRTVELSDAGGGAGAWTVSAPGPRRPRRRSTCPPAERRGSRSRSHRRRAARWATARATSSSRPARTRVHIRWWGYVERPRLAKAHSRHARGRALDHGRHARGHEARRALPLARRAGRAADCRASTRVVSSCGRSSCRTARATPASRPRAPSCRRSCWRATRTGSPASRRCPRTATRTWRPTAASSASAGCSCRRPAATTSSSRRGRATSPGPYRLRLWIDDRTPPSDRCRSAARPGRADRRAALPRRRRAAAASAPRRRRQRRRHAGGRVSVSAAGDAQVRVRGLARGRHRLAIAASDLQETKNSENASALALPNTRTVHTAFTVGGTG